MTCDFSHDYRAGFDFLTELIKRSPIKDYEFTEITMPNGEIERWWRRDGEEIVLKFRKR